LGPNEQVHPVVNRALEPAEEQAILIAAAQNQSRLI
jgi:hypothetical protein